MNIEEEIRKLKKEIERLQTENKKYFVLWNEDMDTKNRLVKEIERLENEVDKWKELSTK